MADGSCSLQLQMAAAGGSSRKQFLCGFSGGIQSQKADFCIVLGFQF